MKQNIHLKTQQWLLEIISLLIALLFLYTASSKLLDFRHFKKEMANQELPVQILPLLIYGLPPLELIAAIGLMIPKLRQIALYVSAFLMMLFTGYIALVTLHFYSRVPCSCAGVFKHMSWPLHLVFNLVVSALAICGILLNHNRHQHVSLSA